MLTHCVSFELAGEEKLTKVFLRRGWVDQIRAVLSGTKGSVAKGNLPKFTWKILLHPETTPRPLRIRANLALDEDFVRFNHKPQRTLEIATKGREAFLRGIALLG